MIAQIAPISSTATTRQSNDSAWPLRRADGTRWCDPRKDERKVKGKQS